MLLRMPMNSSLHPQKGGMPVHNAPLSCKRWLVFRLGHLGDVTLTTGVLAELGRGFGWTFAFVTKTPWAEIFTGNPHIRTVIALDKAELGIVAFASLCRRLASEYADWGLLDLHGSLRSRMLCALWRGPVLRYPKMSMERRIFLHTRAGAEKLLRASVPQRYFMAAGRDVPPPDALLPRIWLRDEERLRARRHIDALLEPGVSPVALHPFAAHSLKTWPEDHWRALAKLLDEKSVPWLILGRGKSLFPDRKQDLSNTTSLRESCALLSCCRSLVSGDSGPLHLAAAVDTPIIALFGPTTREWGFYPAGARDHVLEISLPCRPCSLYGLSSCRRKGECLAGISLESVLKTLEQQDRQA
ncbi:MAG: glycosyltransferase family 9 protein [Desulfovibrio sp.]|nr:glycosyltransferase family 9 protein [Desulfovibrio sp.]